MPAFLDKATRSNSNMTTMKIPKKPDSFWIRNLGNLISLKKGYELLAENI